MSKFVTVNVKYIYTLDNVVANMCVNPRRDIRLAFINEKYYYDIKLILLHFRIALSYQTGN